MAELKYTDELTHETDNIAIKFKGKEPFRIRRHVQDIVMKTLEIDTPKFYLHYLGWDSTSGGFKAEWRAYKPWDRWTNINFIVRTWGAQTLGDPEKNGWATIKLVGTLDTKYEYTHSIQRSLWWSYNYLFYNKNRQQIFEEARNDYFRLFNELKKLYGIYQKEDTVAAKI